MFTRLFIGNLSFQATAEDVRELFQHAGTVGAVRIITDQFTGRSRGFGFVEMATREEAAEAIKMLNGRLFRDRDLVVDEARPQPQRGRGGPRGDRGPRPSGAGGGAGWQGRRDLLVRGVPPANKHCLTGNQGVAEAPPQAASRMRHGHEGWRQVPSGDRHD